ncbi:MAG: T9SS type A sorting domain-containing protein [Saprospiraceae bacterium]
MNRFVLLFLPAFLAAGVLTAQDYSICSQVIGVTGLNTQVPGQKWSYTVGEVAIFTLEDPAQGKTITQGFHQPELCSTTSTTLSELGDWDLILYPNPSVDKVYLHFDPVHSSGLTIQVFDLMGKAMILNQLVLESDSVLFDASSWQPGVYLIQILDKRSGASQTLRFARI